MVIKKLIDRINNDLVVSTDTVKLLNNRIKAFLFQNHQREIHGIQCDIEKCYDSLQISTENYVNEKFRDLLKIIVTFNTISK